MCRSSDHKTGERPKDCAESSRLIFFLEQLFQRHWLIGDLGQFDQEVDDLVLE